LAAEVLQIGFPAAFFQMAINDRLAQAFAVGFSLLEVKEA
jgi:hypothetical protein